MNRPDAVIFDFDGVLFDSEPLHGRAFAATLAPYGIELTTPIYLANYLGLNDREIFARLQSAHGSLRMVAASAFLALKDESYASLTGRGHPPIDGVRTLLGHLQTNRIPLAICSGSRRADINRLLDSAGLSACFEAIVSADDVERSKPDPQGYLRALDLLNQLYPSIRADRTLVIEDSLAGMHAALAANLNVVALRNDRGPIQIPPKVREIWGYQELTDERLGELIQR